MAKSKRKRKLIDWDALELEVFNLRFERVSREDKLKRARRIATTFRRHNEPMPKGLKTLD
jgi:hypothetical protein